MKSLLIICVKPNGKQIRKHGVSPGVSDLSQNCLLVFPGNQEWGDHMNSLLNTISFQSPVGFVCYLLVLEAESKAYSSRYPLTLEKKLCRNILVSVVVHDTYLKSIFRNHSSSVFIKWSNDVVDVQMIEMP